MWCRGSCCQPSGKVHTSAGRGKGTCFPVFLFSKKERLILECVYVKYLRSLSSHVYRFISKITKSKTHRRGKFDWGQGGSEQDGKQHWHVTECVCVSCEEPDPAHSFLECSELVRAAVSKAAGLCPRWTGSGTPAPHRREVTWALVGASGGYVPAHLMNVVGQRKGKLGRYRDKFHSGLLEAASHRVTAAVRAVYLVASVQNWETWACLYASVLFSTGVLIGAGSKGC